MVRVVSITCLCRLLARNWLWLTALASVKSPMNIYYDVSFCPYLLKRQSLSGSWLSSGGSCSKLAISFCVCDHHI